MHISQILKPPFGVDDGKVDVQVTILLLSPLDEVDHRVHGLTVFLGLRGVFGIFGGEEVACCFDPAGDMIDIGTVSTLSSKRSSDKTHHLPTSDSQNNEGGIPSVRHLAAVSRLTSYALCHFKLNAS